MISKGISKERELKNANSNNKLENLKCDYFLQKILNNPSKKIALEFLKYNKKTQQRLNFNINNYKKYCEEYSSIEIEIIPAKNKYGKFITLFLEIFSPSGRKIDPFLRGDYSNMNINAKFIKNIINKYKILKNI